MEQIKRQLIVQRGSIVAALKHVAQARSVQSGIIDASVTWWYKFKLKSLYYCKLFLGTNDIFEIKI